MPRAREKCIRPGTVAAGIQFALGLGRQALDFVSLVLPTLHDGR
jgi:hypothetical protein